VTDSSTSDDETTHEETARGAPKPPGLDGRGDAGDDDDTPPPEARDETDHYEDKYGDAREIANPDQHRDDEPYD
jgi:hypothetical protein